MWSSSLQAVEKALEKVKELLIFDHIEHHLFAHTECSDAGGARGRSKASRP